MLLFFLLTWWSWGLIFISISNTNAYCPNDEDLQQHHCTCNIIHSYIQCSSLPKQCRTCYLYNTIFFDEYVNILSAESFRYYDLFDYDSNRSFTIQFAQLNKLSSNAFSKIDMDSDRTLSIKIAKYTSSIIPARLFDEIEIQSRSKLNIEIFNVTSSLLVIESYAFHGIKLGFESIFRFSILSMKDTIEFQANAGSFYIPAYSTMEFYFSNFVYASLNDHSFNHITQAHSSNLQINFNYFHSASIGYASFYEYHQLDESQFHLIFSNFQDLTIEPKLFHTVTQLKSSITFSLYNITNDLCLPSETFSQIKQDFNSTFQFEIDYGKDVLFTPKTFFNISQFAQSKLSIILRNSYDVYFMNQSIKNIHQQEQSLLDIWIKYGRNLIFQENSIQNIDIQHSSIMRIGYQYSYGTLQMDLNAFANINEGRGGELLFQIMNSSDFSLRFNQSIILEQLEIVDRILTDQDLCRIIDIPSHIPVKLLNENLCSCSVFYLYRHLRHSLNPLILKDLTPLCYINLPLDEIEQEENKCLFDKQISYCHQMQKQNNIETPNGKCSKKSLVISNTQHNSVSYLSLISIFICIIFGLLSIYILKKRQRYLFISNIFNKFSFYYHHHHHQKLPLFTDDSYQQLTSMNENNSDDNFNQEDLSNKMMQIVMKYDSTTKQTQPFIQTDKSDFIVSNYIENQQNEHTTLKLNTNPLSDIEDKQ
ncbi:unnamed protein product [Adineta steineri]|uniref:Transmembrane protein n=1 Tax=Adineta steineri TaxID=433720 RepID=A0A815JF63_9BILA|nr:unnamed protein product [Adineta steineri]CAF1607758.1 unnamed protein product [Adineta steineri]